MQASAGVFCWNIFIPKFASYFLELLKELKDELRRIQAEKWYVMFDSTGAGKVQPFLRIFLLDLTTCRTLRDRLQIIAYFSFSLVNQYNVSTVIG